MKPSLALLVLTALTVMVICLIFGLFLLATPVNAMDLTFSNMCVGYWLRQDGSSVVVQCPNEVDPRLTIADCPGARAKRDESGRIILTCSNGRQYGLH